MKTVFMGTPDFAVPALEMLIESEHEVCAVVTQPDRAKNRGKKIQMTPIKEVAVEHNIKVLQPEKVRGNEEFFSELEKINPEIIIVAAYGQIIPEDILNLPKFGCINIHASLLPRFRGASPIQHAILEGDKVTGVTIMQMAKGLDTGDMLLKDQIEIGKMNSQQLHDKLAELGGLLLEKALPMIEAGKLVPEKQDDSLSTYAGMISKDDGKISFENETAEEIDRKVRAFFPWPGAFCNLGDKVMKIKEVELVDGNSEKKPGTIIKADKDGIDVAAKSGVIRIKVLQMPGKRAMKVDDFLRGNSLEIGEVLE